MSEAFAAAERASAGRRGAEGYAAELLLPRRRRCRANRASLGRHAAAAGTLPLPPCRCCCYGEQ